MISRDLAQELAPLLDWQPANGDQFFIPREEIADLVFTLSDMVVEYVRDGVESMFKFNGTTEWALDSVETAAAVWLPREDQLREHLGGHFLSLDRQGLSLDRQGLSPDGQGSGHVVTWSDAEGTHHTEPMADAADAYAVALLAARRRGSAGQPSADTATAR